MRLSGKATFILDSLPRWRVATVGIIVAFAVLCVDSAVRGEGDVGEQATRIAEPAPVPAAVPVVGHPPAGDLPPLAKRPRRLPRIELERMPPEQVFAQRLLELFTYSWFVCIGAVVGSFLNVVIYRWPAGLSLLYPPSRCSSCLAPILIQHNLPVIGWLWLGGRCYACDAKVSARYPLIEATIAALFLAVAAIEFTSGGANLPVRAVNTYTGVLWTVWHLKIDLLGIYLYHTNFLTGLIAAGMIIWDGHRLPLKLLSYLAVTVLVPAFLWGELHPVPFRTGLSNTITHSTGTTLEGALAGLLLGGAAWFLVLGARRTERRLVAVDLLLVSGLFGAVVGWQATLSFLAITMLFALGGALCVRVAGCCDLGRGSGIVVALAAVTQILAWKPLTGLPFLPQPDSSPLSVWPTVAGLFALAVLSRTLAPPESIGDAAARDLAELDVAATTSDESASAPIATCDVTGAAMNADDSSSAPNPS